MQCRYLASALGILFGAWSMAAAPQTTSPAPQTTSPAPPATPPEVVVIPPVTGPLVGTLLLAPMLGSGAPVLPGVLTDRGEAYPTREPLLSDDGRTLIQIAVERPAAAVGSTDVPPIRHVVRVIDVVNGTARELYRTPGGRTASCSDPGDAPWPFATLGRSGARMLFHVREMERTGEGCFARREEVVSIDLGDGTISPVVATASRTIAANADLSVLAWIEAPTPSGTGLSVCSLKADTPRRCRTIDAIVPDGTTTTAASVALAGDGRTLLLARGTRGAVDTRLFDTDTLQPLGGPERALRGPSRLASGECTPTECGQLLQSHVGGDAGWFLLAVDTTDASAYGRTLLYGRGEDGMPAVVDPIRDVLARPGSGYVLGDLWALLRAPASYGDGEFARDADRNFGLASPALGIVPVPVGTAPRASDEIGAFCARYNSICASLSAFVVRGDLVVVGWSRSGASSAFGVPVVHLSWPRSRAGTDVEARQAWLPGTAVLSVSRNGRFAVSVDTASPELRLTVHDLLATPVTKYVPFSVDQGPQGGVVTGAGCFIATAVYGDAAHPNVMRLRRFRDEVLSTRVLGRAFVQAYYRWSPPAARFVEQREWLRAPIGRTLDGIVLALDRPVPVGAAVLAVVLLPVAATGLRRRARSRLSGT